MTKIFLTIGAFIAWVGSVLGVTPRPVEPVAITPTVAEEVRTTPSPAVSASVPVTPLSSPAQKPISTPVKKVSGGTVLSDVDLAALASDTYASGSVPLGDYKYVTAGAKKGYVYLCNVRKDNPGSMVTGTWMHGSTWNFKEKVKVDGSVSWSEATFGNVINGTLRTLTTKALPINHTTGVYPVASSDDAHNFDPNPNTIKAQSITKQLLVNPAYSETPYCMGGEVGIMLTGVPLFNAFDAGLRDAPAHELQDSCDGHPQGSGEYHYHSMSGCFKDVSVKTVLGYAYDGFPITGDTVSTGKYLTTEDLDECHGITSEVVVDGTKKTTYHYVLTKDFPYSASCFRGKPISSPMSLTPGGQQNHGTAGGQKMAPSSGMAGQPPQEAISACSGKQTGSSCSFTGMRGENLSGSCQSPQGTLACVPNR